MDSRIAIEIKSKNYVIDGDKVVKDGKKYALDNADLMKNWQIYKMSNKIINFTFDKIVELHNDLIENSGGDHGVMNPSSLEFALDRIMFYSDETSLFEDIALLLRGITQDHPFVDGNKRTGLVVAQSILIQNGLILDLDDTQIETFIIGVAKCEFKSIKELSSFLKKNCVELD